jgi:hypothetical protein
VSCLVYSRRPQAAPRGPLGQKTRVATPVRFGA